jgi:hypothetical protein
MAEQIKEKDILLAILKVLLLQLHGGTRDDLEDALGMVWDLVKGDLPDIGE